LTWIRRQSTGTRVSLRYPMASSAEPAATGDEELRVQTRECIRLTTEARLETQAAKEKSQRERATRERTNSKTRPADSRRNLR
jgi:hypothetical protein